MAEFWLDGDTPAWKSPFAYFLCLNEEDGLDFRTLQEVSGAQQLRVFWQGDDVTDRVDEFENLVESHQLSKVFRLRVVAIIEELAATHLDRMMSVARLEEEKVARETYEEPRKECTSMAEALREVESTVLEAVLVALGEEVRASRWRCTLPDPEHRPVIWAFFISWRARNCETPLSPLR